MVMQEPSLRNPAGPDDVSRPMVGELSEGVIPIISRVSGYLMLAAVIALVAALLF